MVVVSAIERAFPKVRAGQSAKYLIYVAVFFQSASIVDLVAPGGDIDHSSADSNPLAQIVAVGLLFWSLAAAYFSRVNFKFFLRGMLPFLPFLCWALVSVLWSNFPDLTVRRSMRLTIDVITFVLTACSLRNEENVLRSFFGAFLVVVLLDVASFAAPSISFKDPWGFFSGIHYHKNGAGLFFAIAIPVLVFGIFDRSISKSRLVAIGASVAAVGMLALTGAKTALGVLVIATTLVGLTYVIDRRRGTEAVLATLVCIIVIAVLMIIIIDVGFSETLTVVFGDPSLTGRDQLWGYTLYRFHDSAPLTGVGYGALWQNGDYVKRSLESFGVDYVVNEAHNGYLDILAQLGYIGLASLIFFLLTSFRRNVAFIHSDALSKSRLLAGLYGLYLLYGSLIFGVTESFFFIGGGMLWMVQVFFSTYIRSDPGMRH